MSKYFAWLLAAFLVAGTALGGIAYKESKQDDDITFYVNDGGVVKQADLVIKSTGEASLPKGFVTTDVVAADFTVESGTTVTYPIMDLTAGRTITVNGTLCAAVISGGTITGPGPVRPC